MGSGIPRRGLCGRGTQCAPSWGCRGSCSHSPSRGDVWGPDTQCAPIWRFMGSRQPTCSHLGSFWVLAADSFPPSSVWGPAAAQGGCATCHWAQCRSDRPHPAAPALLHPQPCIPQQCRVAPPQTPQSSSRSLQTPFYFSLSRAALLIRTRQAGLKGKKKKNPTYFKVNIYSAIEAAPPPLPPPVHSPNICGSEWDGANRAPLWPCRERCGLV